MAKRVRSGGPKRPKALRVVDATCSSEACANAARILATAHESAMALLKAFNLARDERGRPRGMSTDEEQDLLRAMLVLAAAGLDGMVKQLIREALPSVLDRDERAQEALEKFIARQIRAEVPDADRSIGAKFLARVLSRPSPQRSAIDEYVRHLTGGSLQSSASLYEVVGALGLWPDEVGVDRKVLDPIFDVRNKIIHELDINLVAERRTRNLRSRGAMITYTDHVLLVGEKILKGVDAKLEVRA